jgi:hypothetical protein
LKASSKIVALGKVGFGVTNLYTDHKYIEHILDSEHKFWLFEETEEKNEKRIFSLIKLKDANSILGKFFRKSSNTLKNRASNMHNSTRKRKRDESKGGKSKIKNKSKSKGGKGKSKSKKSKQVKRA